MGLFRKEEEYTQKMIRESGLEERKRKSKLEKYNDNIDTKPRHSVSKSGKPIVSTTNNELQTMPSQGYGNKSYNKKNKRLRKLIGVVLIVLYVLTRLIFAFINFWDEETTYEDEVPTPDVYAESLADSILITDTAKLRFYSCAANTQDDYSSKRYIFNDYEFNQVFDEASGYSTYFENEAYFAFKELGPGEVMYTMLSEDYCFYNYLFTDDKYTYYITVEDDMPYVEVHDNESEDWGVYYFDVGEEGSFEEDYVSNNTLEFDESLVLSNYHIFEQEFTNFFGFNPVDTPKSTSEINN